MNFLSAAYTATWLILLAYLLHLAMRYKRIRREVNSLRRKS